MSAVAARVAGKKKKLSPSAKRWIWAGLAVVVLLAMFTSTKIVQTGSGTAQGPAAFNAAAYGKQQFPKLQAFIDKNAVDASILATAIRTDPASAAKKYGKSSDGATYVIPVRFTGVLGKIPSDGYTPATVDGLPSGTHIGLQLGPAINGTDLRDVTGNITLNNFENQIQLQDAGAAINDQLRAELTKINAQSLTGKTVQVYGAFTLINPQQWNVTPSRITVEK
ncbi:DUF2291 family protein [Arthrobacter sp. SDTb3-6]|uniref:DUF2291 family protein n=1 Tax=Arthrobacter sp. SDTb3-6 TaxID=2713571 RepID=UPI00159D1D2C|nr:DUF2291 domain-containing protein [Arthrobacter sp. SDTb3-6]NVN00499.1 DUF2291 domain-containing protein [Arthrobacter sp. SDTb3-6]